MDFPKFDGTNPQEWLRTMVYVPEDTKLDYAQMYITRKADTWLRNSGVLEENLNWQQLCQVLCKRFQENSSYEAVEEFNSLRQGSSSVSEYADKFEDKMAAYKKENPDVKEGYYIKCYINGLRGEIKHYLKSFKPTSLYEAVESARDMEQGASAQTRRYNSQNPFQQTSTTTSYKNKYRPPHNMGNKPPEKQGTRPEVKYKEPGQCRYCGQRWFFGHTCAQYKSLNLMATEESEAEWED